jgi:hypothetical protein
LNENRPARCGDSAIARESKIAGSFNIARRSMTDYAKIRRQNRPWARSALRSIVEGIGV